MKTMTWAVGVLLLSLLVLPSADLANADEEERSVPLETRIFRVGALTMGKQAFIGEVAPPVLPHQMSDEENPLFGAEAEEPYYPIGQVDEMIELIKSGVDPVFWESTEGADMRSLGEDHLVVRASPAIHAEIARFLARFETETLRSTRVEVQAVPIEAGHDLPTDAAGLEAWLAGPEGGLALSFVTWSDQRVSAVSGRQHAYVVDYDTSVAQDSTVSDPMISVANLGLMADVRLTPLGSGGGSLVDAWIRVADLEAPRAVSTGEHRAVEAPGFERAIVHSLVEAPSSVWTSAGRGGEWAFFLRVTPAPYEAPPAKIAPLPDLTPTGGKFELRHFIVTDLWTFAYPTIAWPNHLWPSRYTPPEPPELPEPQAFLGFEYLVDLIRTQGRGELWEDPATIEARNGRIIARNDPGVLAGAARVIADLRTQFLWTLTTQAELVEMPTALANRLQGQGPAAYVLDAGAARTLAEARREGHAHTMARAEVLNHRSTRNAVSSGRRVTYLQDYEGEIAQGAAIANPVMNVFLSGLQLDLRTELTSAGDAAAIEVRFMQTEHEDPIRKLDTPMGPLELPELDVFRVRTSLLVPLGRTVVLASRGEGDHRQVLLLTPRLKRSK